MTSEIVERVLRSSRYRDVDRAMVDRLAAEELPRARSTDDAVKRVKRRLHQAVGAFRGAGRRTDLAGAWSGDLGDPAFRAACAEALHAHASTRERIPHLDAFYRDLWTVTGRPRGLLDLGCGLNPLALPWMGLDRDALYVAADVDQRPLETVRDFLTLVGQPHEVHAIDAVAEVPAQPVDVALLLKLVPTLDRQDPDAAVRLLRGVNAGHAVVSFPARSLGGHGKGMDRTYRERLRELTDAVERVRETAEASVSNELVFVLTLDPIRG